MAMGRLIVCSACNVVLEAWDEGHPYFVTEAGAKQYAHHPDARRDDCQGIDVDIVCLACGHQDVRDRAKKLVPCSGCQSTDVVGRHELDGRPCPYCKAGHLSFSKELLIS